MPTCTCGQKLIRLPERTERKRISVLVCWYCDKITPEGRSAPPEDD